MNAERMKCKTKEIVDYLKANGQTLHEVLFCNTGGYENPQAWWTAIGEAMDNETIGMIHGAKWEVIRGSDTLDPDFTPEPSNPTPCTIDPTEV